jgi:hypothetical protein
MTYATRNVPGTQPVTNHERMTHELETYKSKTTPHHNYYFQRPVQTARAEKSKP